MTDSTLGKILAARNESAPYGYTWEEWKAIGDFADEIDFDCQFDDEGKCKRIRSGGYSPRCCCGGCAGAIGYLRRVPVEAVETIIDLYDDENGFWSPEGCKLPRKWRSSICQTYRCGRVDSDGWNAFRELIYKRSKLTIEEIREIMRKEGLLKVSQLVQIS